MPPDFEQVQVRTQIEKAFARVSYPGDDNLVSKVDFRDLEREEIADFFRGKRWQTLTGDELESQNSALSFFTTDALHYYIPAFLIHALDWYNADIAAHYLIYTIVPSFYDSSERFKTKIPEFDAPQRRAIRDTLLYIVSIYPEATNEVYFASCLQYWSALSQTAR